MKTVNTEDENLRIFWTTWKISKIFYVKIRIFIGKIRIILFEKATGNQIETFRSILRVKLIFSHNSALWNLAQQRSLLLKIDAT